jgi:hypothetical protein
MAYLADYNTPRYWTAAVWKQIPGRGLIFQGYTPAKLSGFMPFLAGVKAKYDVFAGFKLKHYYWDGARWILDSDRVSGEPAAGKLERRSPLPVGRYWQDIFAKQARDWDLWVQPKIADGSVKIVKFEYFRADPLHDGSWLPDVLKPDSAGTIAARSWLLFDVVRPVAWPATKLGYPTIADQTIQSSSDTAQVPAGPTPLEEIGDAITGVLKPVAYVAGAVLAFKLWQELRR